MLAARALLDSDWSDLLIETGLLARPQATAALRIALERRLRTYGVDDWLVDLESLAAGLNDPVELATLLTAALGASSSLRDQPVPERLLHRAEVLHIDLKSSRKSIAKNDGRGAGNLDELIAMLEEALEQAGARREARAFAPGQAVHTGEMGRRMNTAAKRALSSTIRSLRARLLDDLHAATDTAYRFSVRTRDAGLDEAARVRRGRLEAWMAEQMRAQKIGKARTARTAEDFRREAEKQAAYTLLNRLVLLRLMEAPGPSGEPLRSPAVVTDGWDSRAYKDFRQLAQGLVRDESEGYAFLLQLVFEDLATELPGLYGPAGVADLVPVPAATLRHVVDALERAGARELLDRRHDPGLGLPVLERPGARGARRKLHSGGKVEPHEIASKTQMFTERYMVDWLLQNSLGPMWLAMCKKHGWTPEVEADGTLDALEAAPGRMAGQARDQQGGGAR
jgi:hypothetical protein